ncbi:PEP-CTERM/exosortase system-associated acyltransferase [Agarivorans aestuarii]|uniref:PEP-CTERM/exosortase system-associated acyltransferase n=1 Tax=Agarivorans aestuarii TaxID=1563703 RepID=UPI001C7E8A51|nr:PEP-CTERM/exosortase system-associated acyltransferase [Agarivorans aestuarii]
MSNQQPSTMAPRKLQLSASSVKQLSVQHQADELAQRYQRYFQASIASNDEEVAKIYQLRHRVYCEEFQFEPSNQLQMERDVYDGYSHYCRVQHLNSGLDAGCLRMVSPNKQQSIPLLDTCKSAISHQELHPENFAKESICEVSRVALDTQFRRRKIDRKNGATPAGAGLNEFSQKELRTFPYITMSLYLAASIVAEQCGIKHAYVMVEPKLARSLSMFGIKMTRIGPNIDYHGIRAAYHITLERFQEHLPMLYQPLFELIKQTVQPSPALLAGNTQLSSLLTEI